MSASYEYWIDSRYAAAVAANQDAGRIPDPDMAVDAKSGGVARVTGALFKEMARLRKYWSDYFDDFAKKLADQTAEDWEQDNTRAWTGKLGRAGFDIKMQVTPAQTLIVRAKVAENVALIKSIQESYHKEVEGIVLRNFIAGRDLAPMAEQIKARGGVSTRRAAFIARDQSNKATAELNSARQRELGLTWATWVHSSAGKEPRHKHVMAGREQWVFNTQDGIDFKDGFGTVKPGEAINCRCGSRTIIPAIGRGDIRGLEDLHAVSGYPGAYRAKPGRDAGPKPKQDVTKTRLPGQPVKYS